MKKPYDELLITANQLDDWGHHAYHRGTMESWLKFKLGLKDEDELEWHKDDDRNGLVVKYKRYELQYG